MFNQCLELCDASAKTGNKPDGSCHGLAHVPIVDRIEDRLPLRAVNSGWELDNEKHAGLVSLRA